MRVPRAAAPHAAKRIEPCTLLEHALPARDRGGAVEATARELSAAKGPRACRGPLALISFAHNRARFA